MLHRSVNAGRWAEPRLTGGDFKAALFADFRIDDDGISTWSGPVETAVKAIAVLQDEVQSIALLEIPEELLSELGVSVSASSVSTPGSVGSDYHRSIECFSGPLLARLIDRLSDRPSYFQVDAEAVRGLLGECLTNDLTLEELRPRVIEDLIRNQVVDELEGQQALGEHYASRPGVLARLKARTVHGLVEAGIVARERAVHIHPGLKDYEAGRR